MVMRGGFVKAPDSAGAAAAPDPFAHGGDEKRCRSPGLNENGWILPYDPSANLPSSTPSSEPRRLTWNRSSPVLLPDSSAARSPAATGFEVFPCWPPVERPPPRRRILISRPPQSTM